MWLSSTWMWISWLNSGGISLVLDEENMDFFFCKKEVFSFLFSPRDVVVDAVFVDDEDDEDE